MMVSAELKGCELENIFFFMNTLLDHGYIRNLDFYPKTLAKWIALQTLL